MNKKYDNTNAENYIDIASRAMEALKEERTLRHNAEQELEAQKNKVLFADAAICSSESVLVGDVANMLKQCGVAIGRDRLFEWLRGNGYVYRQPCGDNRPTQKSLELGILEVKQTARVNAYGKVDIERTLKVTPKGQLYLFEKVMADKERINAMEAEKKAAKMKRDYENRKKKKAM